MATAAKTFALYLIYNLKRVFALRDNKYIYYMRIIRCGNAKFFLLSSYFSSNFDTLVLVILIHCIYIRLLFMHK